MLDDFGLINYDVRLENFIVGKDDGRVWLIDFGHVRRKSLEIDGAPMKRTRSGY